MGRVRKLRRLACHDALEEWRTQCHVRRNAIVPEPNGEEWALIARLARPPRTSSRWQTSWP